jgi:tagaturonate reductase
MRLSEKTIRKIKPVAGLTIPRAELFRLPEKVLQFGTGVLLRGLPDYFIDKANRNHIFNGRVVVVKSTAQGSADAFDKQDGLYTLCVRGIENGVLGEETIINSCISRVLSAQDHWGEILKCARNPEIKIVISNTTEVGIVLTDDDILLSPPTSFPGKLLAVLYERYRAFYGREDGGMVIIPTELIEDNGDKLRAIVVELARRNRLETDFIQWLQSANHFCNSLVDRIVPGKMPTTEQKVLEEKLGYEDELMILAETFRLWAIQSSSQRVRELLSFSIADERVIIAPDINKFRELKLRLLNGTHTFSCGLAHLAGFKTVREAMHNELFAAFVRRLMMLEIATVLDSRGQITYNEACAFASDVLDRFRNPFLEHQWLSISLNYSSKMKLRNLPLLLQHYARTNEVPANMALGFAAYILFMRCTAGPGGKYYGSSNGASYLLQDDAAGIFAGQNTHDMDNFVDSILANTQLWGTDLTHLAGFAEAVKEDVRHIEKRGVLDVLATQPLKKKSSLT